jgi:hypothetical protein
MLVAGLVVLAVAGCASAASNAAVRTTPSPSQSASPAREVSPSASPSSHAPASAAAWKLPVATNDGGSTARGGFVSLPDGTFTPDPSANLTNSTAGSPPLKGTWPRTNFAIYPSYDAQFGRWVPVSPQQLTLDGKQYAYAEWVMPTGPVQGPTPPSDIRVHVVDVATAGDRVVYTTNKLLLSVVAYGPDGIYVTNQCWEGCGNVGGLWLLDPTSGQLRTILGGDVDHTDWRWMANGFVWGMGPWGPDTIATTVFRLDLSTGAVTRWFTPSKAVDVVAVDAQGFPLIETQDPYSGAVELWDGTSSSAGTRIFVSSTVVHFGSAVSGGCGTWIGSTNGLYELTSADTLRVVKTTMVLPPGGLEVTGMCIAG